MEAKINLQPAKLSFAPFDAKKAYYKLQSFLLDKRNELVHHIHEHFAENLKEHVQECHRLFKERQFTVREQNTQLFHSQLLTKLFNGV